MSCTTVGLRHHRRTGVDYTDGSEETCSGSGIFYWPPGHSVRVTADAEVILFSPQVEHMEMLDHMVSKMGEA